MTEEALPRRYIAAEANYRQLIDYRPNVAILPWGATEAHNYHLPLGTDIFEATAVAQRAADLAHQRGGKPIVLPTIPFGNNAQQLDQVSTIHLSTTAAAAVLNDVAASLCRQDIDRLVILNGHGGNVAPCQGIWGQFLQRLEINLQFHSYWDFLDDEAVSPYLETGRFPGHAQEFETAFALAVFPENVREDAMQDQEDKEPLSATAENGAAMVETIITRVAAHVQAMVDGESVADVPAFH